MNGKRFVVHLITATYRDVGSTGDHEVVGNRVRRPVYVSADMLDSVLQLPTNAEIRDAYIDLLVNSWGNPEPDELEGWTEAVLQEYLANNDFATQAAADAHSWLTSVVPDYPPAYFKLS